MVFRGALTFGGGDGRVRANTSRPRSNVWKERKVMKVQCISSGALLSSTGDLREYLETFLIGTGREDAGEF